MRQWRFARRAVVVAAVLALAGVLAGGSQASSGSSYASQHTLAPGFLKSVHAKFKIVAPPRTAGGAKGLSFKSAQLFSEGIPGLDSISNWDDSFTAPGFGPPPNGAPRSNWFLNTVGNPPSTTGTTNFDAPIVPVIVSLRNPDGSQAFLPNGQPLIENPLKDVVPVLHSPIFQRSRYTSSSIPTQFTDAIQRAEYWGQEKSNWHTELSPSVKAARELDIPAGHWQVGVKTDGSLRFMLIDENSFIAGMFPPTFPVDNTTVLGSAELSGDITTRDISSFLFQNTFLYAGSVSNCCIVGFHTFDFEPGVASNGNRPRAYVMNFSSWTSPNIFRNNAEDITALSHEMSELYNDPFVGAFGDNFTPWWLAPNGLCQDNRETGDVIEQLPDQSFPITMHHFTYHPQNEALLPYFEFQTPSTAIDGAYSYPDETVLSGPSTPQNFECK
jgi:hypothetical protein